MLWEVTSAIFCVANSGLAFNFMFSRVVKYLDLRKANRDETLVTKPFTLRKARAIKKVQDSLVFPITTVPWDGIPHILFQFNVTVGYEFSLTNFTGSLEGGFLFIKYREGATVTRYKLPIDSILSVAPEIVPLPLSMFYNNGYTNQRIPSNCVFEFWGIPYFMANPGIVSPVTLQLSKLRNPAYPEDQGTNTDIADALFIDDLGVDLPENLPYNQDNQVWLDNP